MEQQLRETIELATLKEMAVALLGSEKKELKEITKFHIDGVTAMPKGVFGTIPGRYALTTPDGMVEVKEGDYILQTTDNQFYFIRMEIVE